MISRVESGQNWLETITHQMNNVRRPLYRFLFFHLKLACCLVDVVCRTVRQARWPHRIVEAVRLYSYPTRIYSSCWCMILLRRYITKTGRETAEDSTQIFGGRGITKTGMGKFIENVRF